ncbi:MAG: hypothetical protein LBJ10_01895 [Clostridiales bacterium]|nr:hypothetical protein [Clostridiales bacterium]
MARKDAQGGAGMAAGETADRGTRADAHGGARGAARTRIECGLRVNPEYSEVAAGIYNPCAPFSRLGTTLAGLGGPGGRPASELRGEAGNELGGEAAGRGGLALARGAAAPFGERGGHGKNGAPGNGPSGPDSAGAPGNLGSLGGTDWLDALDGLDGLHFHTMCEQGVDTLARTLAAVEQKFGRLLKRVKWANFGGGHHITRPGYDVAALIGCVARFQDRYGAAVYLEPGEAVALNAGFLVATVLDTTENGMGIAILDTSAACHMPDVLEMPYRPHILGSGRPGELACTYRLGGPTCLAGDTIGDYSFDRPLAPGDRLVFTDMAHYTMVKNNTFNGVNLPSVALLGADGHVSALRRFGYEDFKGRLS